MPDDVLRRFYDAFAARDGETMAACYADDVVFSDPVFPRLVGDEACAMWRMLTRRAQDFSLEYEVTGPGRVHWEARYLFSATGRRVHNVIDATIEVKDGLIVRHTDAFGFWRWSRQALGLPGLVLGWTPLLQKKVQRTAAKGLAAFRREG
jgi:ketosteroid isomerase-like protein